MNKIRVANSKIDYERVAALLNKVWSSPVSASWLKNADERMVNSPVMRRCVMENGAGKIVGYSIVLRSTDAAEGSFYLDVIVDPEHRKKGVGSSLYEEALAFAIEKGATIVDCEAYDNCPPCREFIEKRGFKLERHLFESVVDLERFDYGRFSHIVEEVEQGGIRFFSLADEGDTEEARRKLHQINYDCSLDDPASSGTFIGFEEFNHMFDTADWFIPEGQLLAADGDIYVGLSALAFIKENQAMYNNMTGVIRPYRGRKIAQALKIVALKFAKAYGAKTIRTHNDSQNHAMLAVNRKLGYVPQVGELRFKRKL